MPVANLQMNLYEFTGLLLSLPSSKKPEKKAQSVALWQGNIATLAPKQGPKKMENQDREAAAESAIATALTHLPDAGAADTRSRPT